MTAAPRMGAQRYLPVLVTMMPQIMAEIGMKHIKGMSWTPDCAADLPRTSWKNRGRYTMLPLSSMPVISICKHPTATLRILKRRMGMMGLSAYQPST